MLRFLFILFFFGTLGASAGDLSSYDRELKDWREKRVQNLTAPESWLSLIGRHPLAVGANSLGSSKDNRVVLAAGPAQLGVITVEEGKRPVFAPAQGLSMTLNQAPLVGPVSLDPDKPDVVRVGTLSFHLLQRGGVWLLRVRDSECQRRTHFVGIESFPIDPSWRIEARWVPFEQPREVSITNILGQAEKESATGKIVFEREGQSIELIPLEEGPESPLFVVFSDGTSGEDTYGMRFLYAERAKDGKVLLDFNKAYNPPCAFTPFAACPLPPRENRLKLRIEAGEKTYKGQHD